MADEQITGGTQTIQGGAGSPPSAGQVAPPPAQTPSVQPSSQGVTGGAGSGIGGEGQPAPLVPIHEALKQYGYQLPQGVEGQAALQHLVLQARQAEELRQYADYGKVYLQHADQFNGWLRQQQEAERAKQAQEQKWWNAPEFDPNWRTKLVRDPNTGELRPAPGADPNIVSKYLQALEHQQGFLDKFTFNPIDTIKPGIEEVAREVARQVVQESLGGYQANNVVQGFEQQNASWLYQHDQAGQPVRDQMTGQPQFSEWGTRFVRYGQALRQQGINDMQQILQMSLAFVQRDFLMASQRGAGAQQAGDQSKQNFLQQAAGAAHVPQQGGSLAGAAVPGGTPQNGKIPLADRMRQALKTNGVTDDQVMSTLNGRR